MFAPPSEHKTHRPQPATASRIQSCPATERFIAAVAERSGCHDGDRLSATVVSILGSLAQRLRPIDAREVAKQLPAALAPAFATRVYDDASATAPTELRPGVMQSGHPEAHVRAVCQVLAESLDEQARAHLRIQPLVTLFRGAA